MSRKVCITAVDGQTGFLIAELLLTDDKFKKQVDSVTGLALDPNSAKAKEFAKLGAVIVPHKPGREREMNQADIDHSEKEYILEYYSLVREGKTNYISTTAFHDVTGQHPTEPDEFFRNYAGELRPKKKLRSS